MGNETAVLAGIELVKMLLMLAMQEARRANLTPEQIGPVLADAMVKFLDNDPDKIPDV